MKCFNLGERDSGMPLNEHQSQLSGRFPYHRQLSESEDEQPKAKKSKKAKALSIPAHATKELKFSDDEDAPSDDVSAIPMPIKH